mmetsp:Transcript_66475/g.194515  ORF Transcript_66475/g.194515 Transcript_66475/m.194515 type:complete len:207 (-) Transcript_66475:117-737(-)
MQRFAREQSSACTANPWWVNCSSSVHEVVDAVLGVCRVCWQAHQVCLILLDDRHDLLIQVGDVVNLLDLLVGPVRGNGARRCWVHAGELAVGLHVGVVDVHLVAPSEILKAFNIHHRRRSGGRERHCGGGRHRSRLLAAAREPPKHGAHSHAGGSHGEWPCTRLCSLFRRHHGRLTQESLGLRCAKCRQVSMCRCHVGCSRGSGDH